MQIKQIKIINSQVCESCKKRTCSAIDSVEKSLFTIFKSEKFTCPLKILVNGPSDEQMHQGFIDISDLNPQCIHCYLCIGYCSQKNLFEQEKPMNMNDIFRDKVIFAKKNSPGLENVLASLYLNYIFGFAANTSLNNSLLFDGFILDNKDESYFVEVDATNDSLESCRRLLGDILLQNFRYPNLEKVNAGVMVLSDFPKSGSRDIFSLIQALKSFPGTSSLRIYVTTFELLRYFYRHSIKKEVSTLLMDISSESVDDYHKRMVANNFINPEIANKLFSKVQ